MPSLEDEFNTIKIVVLIEQEPLTDKFVQIMFTEDQYKLLTKFLWDNQSVESNGFVVSERYKHIYLSNIPEMYSEDDLENPLK